ncbi:MAG TPA: alpha/beta hydrolase [Blastocatellia bacterium]|nr:alpha/beta hydrolase [Blastocatellia bacterium]
MTAGQKAKGPMFRHEYADVNGVRLHYAAAGKGKLVMFVHGFPEFWYEYKDQLAEFGKDHLAVAPDMRGYNLSSKPEDVEQYQIKYLVEDLRALAEHLGHKKFTLVAHDWGGVAAWAFAMAHPDYLDRLIIINSPHPGVFQRELRENPAQQKASGYMLVFRGPQAEQILSANNYAALVQAVLGEGLKNGYFTEEDKKAYIEAWSQPGALTGGLNYYRASRAGPPSGEGANASADLGAQMPSLMVKVPTLVIWGEKDTALLTGNLDGLDKFVPDLTVRRIPDGTHWVIHEKPELINGYIRDFMAGKLK